MTTEHVRTFSVQTARRENNGCTQGCLRLCEELREKAHGGRLRNNDRPKHSFKYQGEGIGCSLTCGIGEKWEIEMNVKKLPIPTE